MIVLVKYHNFIQNLTHLLHLNSYLGIPFAKGREALPTKSKVAIRPLLSIVGGTRSRTKSAKESRTFYSQQQYFNK